MLMVLQYWAKKKAIADLFGKYFYSSTWDFSNVCSGPVTSDPLIFPHFCVAGDLFNATHFPLSCVPRFCSLDISAFSPMIHSLLAACLPASKLQEGRHQLGLSGLGSVWPGATVISSADCGGCGSDHPNPTHHQSALNIDRVNLLTFESNLQHSNVPILPSLCPPSPLRFFFCGLFSFLLLIFFPLSLIIRMYVKTDSDQKTLEISAGYHFSLSANSERWQQRTSRLCAAAVKTDKKIDFRWCRFPNKSLDKHGRISLHTNYIHMIDTFMYRKYSAQLFSGDHLE